MKKIGIVSYNTHVTYTNYGSALQLYALNKAINSFGYDSYLIDYIPRKFEGFNTLDPIGDINFDVDSVTKELINSSKEAFIENYLKYERFFTNNFKRIGTYDRHNFNKLGNLIDGFVCGSDTIFCIDEFGYEDGYFANYPIMRGHSVAFSASFGDFNFDANSTKKFAKLINNFNAVSIREDKYLNHVRSLTNVRVERTIDPTLLLKKEDYEPIIAKRQIEDNYILYYSRRFNKKMDDLVRKLAKENNLKVVEISLFSAHSELGSVMRYDAGVEEFLSLIKHSSIVVTNSFHGMLLSIVFKKQFYCFSRPENGHKMVEITSLLGIRNRLTLDDCFKDITPINYDEVDKILDRERRRSLEFLKYELDVCLK